MIVQRILIDILLFGLGVVFAILAILPTRIKITKVRAEPPRREIGRIDIGPTWAELARDFERQSKRLANLGVAASMMARGERLDRVMEVLEPDLREDFQAFDKEIK